MPFGGSQGVSLTTGIDELPLSYLCFKKNSAWKAKKWDGTVLGSAYAGMDDALRAIVSDVTSSAMVYVKDSGSLETFSDTVVCNDKRILFLGDFPRIQAPAAATKPAFSFLHAHTWGGHNPRGGVQYFDITGRGVLIDGRQGAWIKHNKFSSPVDYAVKVTSDTAGEFAEGVQIDDNAFLMGAVTNTPAILLQRGAGTNSINDLKIRDNRIDLGTGAGTIGIQFEVTANSLNTAGGEIMGNHIWLKGNNQVGLQLGHEAAHTVLLWQTNLGGFNFELQASGKSGVIALNLDGLDAANGATGILDPFPFFQYTADAWDGVNYKRISNPHNIHINGGRNSRRFTNLVGEIYQTPDGTKWYQHTVSNAGAVVLTDVSANYT